VSLKSDSSSSSADLGNKPTAAKMVNTRRPSATTGYGTLLVRPHQHSR
jgi:hypothetical protein